MIRSHPATHTPSPSHRTADTFGGILRTEDIETGLVWVQRSYRTNRQQKSMLVHKTIWVISTIFSCSRQQTILQLHNDEEQMHQIMQIHAVDTRVVVLVISGHPSEVTWCCITRYYGHQHRSQQPFMWKFSLVPPQLTMLGQYSSPHRILQTINNFRDYL